jgi:CBS domain-containing protein
LGGGAGMGKPGRVAVAARDDALRTVVERLSLPGVRRLVVVQRGTGRVEGVVSLSDVAALLFM